MVKVKYGEPGYCERCFIEVPLRDISNDSDEMILQKAKVYQKIFFSYFDLYARMVKLKATPFNFKRLSTMKPNEDFDKLIFCHMENFHLLPLRHRKWFIANFYSIIDKMSGL